MGIMKRGELIAAIVILLLLGILGYFVFASRSNEYADAGFSQITQIG